MSEDTKDLMLFWNNAARNIGQKKWWNVVLACIWWTVQKGMSNVLKTLHTENQDEVFLSFMMWCKENYVEGAETIFGFFEAL